MTRPRSLACACCGETAIGRQWWNRDTGFRLCAACVPLILRQEGEGALRQSYGIPGVHYAVELTPSAEPGELVTWKTIAGDRLVGTLKEIDNGTAIVATDLGEIGVRVA